MQSRSVLVVEDEPAIVDILKEVLADAGYEVRSATNGEEALTILREWTPGVILLDLRMPVMDGVTFRERQWEAGLAREVPVVVLSGTHSARKVAENIGAVATITKPFDIDEVLTLVESAAPASG